VIRDPQSPVPALVTVSDPSPTTVHTIGLYGLLTPNTKYEYDVLLNGTIEVSGVFSTTSQVGALGTPAGNCGPGATWSRDDLTGIVTCTYNNLSLPGGGANPQPVCPTVVGAQIGFTWTQTPYNINYVCPPGAVQTGLWGLGSCLFPVYPVPQPYEYGRTHCDLSIPRISYQYIPHDPVIGPVLQKYIPRFATNSIDSVGHPIGTAGWSVGIKRGWVDDYYYYGVANFATDVRVKKNTLFSVGSITKTFNGALLAVETQNLGWNIDAPLNTFVPPSYQVPGSDPHAAITLRQAADFSSGYERDASVSFTGNVGVDWGLLWWEFGHGVLAVTPPGKWLRYSNVSHLLLGRAMEVKAGLPWESLLKRDVTGPLGMVDTMPFADEWDTTWLPTAEQLGRVALPYSCTANQVCVPSGSTIQQAWSIPYAPLPIGNPAGGIVTTAADMMQWLRFLMGYMVTSHGWINAQLLQTIRTGMLGWGDPEPPAPPTPLLPAPQQPFTLWTPAGSPTASISPTYQKDGTIPGTAADGSGRGWQATIAFQPQTSTGAFAMSNSQQNDPQGFVENLVTDVSAAQNACANSVADQLFANGMVGCGGAVTWDAAAKLCGAGYTVCTSAQWIANSGGFWPVDNYWTADYLGYSGSINACEATTSGGHSCGLSTPMRVCTPGAPNTSGSTDAYGNRCNWTGCGLNTTNDQFFGGCMGNTTAAALCCKTTG
jgi:CubicO group peptidase (beta-lactamase class C family)